jgi:hypothetical protein
MNFMPSCRLTLIDYQHFVFFGKSKCLGDQSCRDVANGRECEIDNVEIDNQELLFPSSHQTVHSLNAPLKPSPWKIPQDRNALHDEQSSQPRRENSNQPNSTRVGVVEQVLMEISEYSLPLLLLIAGTSPYLLHLNYSFPSFSS